MKTAYSYVRFSTRAQGEEGRDSLRRQYTSAKKWCKENGYTLSNQTFHDKAKSGFTGKNFGKDGQLGRFIALVKAGTIPAGSVLVIDSVDRFSRLPAYRSFRLFSDVIDAGIGLVFAGSYILRGVLTSDVLEKQGNENLLPTLIGEMIRSHAESAEKSRKIKESLAERKAKMQRGEIVPHNNLPRWIRYDKAAKICVEHGDNAPIVKELIQGILEGKTLYGMAGELNERNIKTFKNGYCWNGTAIRKLLQSRSLIGEFLGQKNYLPAVTDEDSFNRVQSILRANKTYGRGVKSELPNIFRGVCFCAECNHSMFVNGQTIKGRQSSFTYRYLVCGQQRGKSPCPNKKSVRLDEIERDFFINCLGEPETLVNADDRKELKELRQQKSAIENQLSKANEEIEKLVTLSEEIGLDELKKKLAKLKTSRDKANAQLDENNSKIRLLSDAPNVRKEAREVFFKTTEFGGGPNGEDVEKIFYVDTQDKINEALTDKATREKLRLAMPSLIGKLTVGNGRFYVYNHGGKQVYKSRQFTSNRNRSARWKQSLSKWTTRQGKPVKRSWMKPAKESRRKAS